MTPGQFRTLAEHDNRPGALPPGKDAAKARDELRRKQGKPPKAAKPAQSVQPTEDEQP